MSDEKLPYVVTDGELTDNQAAELKKLFDELEPLREFIERNSDMVAKYFGTLDEVAAVAAKIHAFLGDDVQITVNEWTELGKDAYFDQYERSAGLGLVDAWVPSNYTC